MTTNKYPRGSEWRKWDLHVHTPASDGTGTPEEIVNKAIEKGLSVIAITDHHSVDYIDQVKEAAKDKDLSVISGIEFRSEYGSKSVHFIAYFPDEYENTNLDSAALKDLILAPLDLSRTKIVAKGKEQDSSLSDDSAFKKGMFLVQVDFKAAADLIHKYGGIISVHNGSKENGLDKEVKHLGKAPKNAHSLYECLGTLKEELMKEYVDICDIEKEGDDEEFYLNTFFKPSILTSDAHRFEDIGSRYTWIKADPTFEGLKQILIEPENRVFIGEKPLVFKTVEDNRTKYIEELSIDCVDGYTGTKGKWFEKIQIPFNNELVAIIGNKGNGKSAISDILSHCCNYKNQEYFSFLNDDKFRNKNLASNFVAAVTFNDGQTLKKGLSDKLEGSEVTCVKYLPQGYFESICNDLQKEENLKSEIEAVVFQYIEESSRLGTANFKELIAKKSDALELDIQQLKSKLSLINKEIIALEDKDYPSYKNSIDASIEQKEKEIAALIVPQEVSKPSPDDEQSKDAISKIEKLKEDIVVLNDTIQKLKDEKSSISITLAKISSFIINVNRLVQNIEDFKQENKSFVESLGGDINGIIAVNKDLSLLESKKSEFESRLKAIEKLIVIDSQHEDSPAFIIKKKQDEINELREKLDGPSKAYQAYLQRKEEYEKSKKRIEGDEATPNTLIWLKKEKEYINSSLSVDLQEKVNERNQCLNEIYNKRKEIISIYQQVKSKLDAKISENKSLLNNYEIRIEASLGLKSSFPDDFLRYVNQSKSGTFRGKESGQAIVQEIVRNCDLQTELGIESFCNSLVEKLKKNDEKEMYIQDQVDDRQTLYDYLFSLDYLINNYSIMQGDKDLSVLSPGEKGALLLVFYLLLDMDNIPLILDQPEDNLDNDSVANILVDFIKEAKKKRQIIMVTHNPNLAVVADAEQIIYVSIDKKDGNKVFVESGSIEDPQINAHIVDVLEGAMPAFRKRDDKYIQ